MSVILLQGVRIFNVGRFPDHTSHTNCMRFEYLRGDLAANSAGTVSGSDMARYAPYGGQMDSANGKIQVHR